MTAAPTPDPAATSYSGTFVGRHRHYVAVTLAADGTVYLDGFRHGIWQLDADGHVQLGVLGVPTPWAVEDTLLAAARSVAMMYG